MEELTTAAIFVTTGHGTGYCRSQRLCRFLCEPARPRLSNIDVLRGLVMVVMALDLTQTYRAFLHAVDHAFSAHRSWVFCRAAVYNEARPLYPPDYGFGLAEESTPRGC